MAKRVFLVVGTAVAYVALTAAQAGAAAMVHMT
jgi:hypothetical protein